MKDVSNNMNISQLAAKKIAILGLGIENYALVIYLFKKNIPCEITICDQRNEKELGDKRLDLIQSFKASKLQRLFWKLGKDYNKNLHKFDILFRSPGYPLYDPSIKTAIRKKLITDHRSPITNFISSPMKLFFDLCPTENIIGVTGTKGKGTTASLIRAIIKASGKRAFLGGNIGIAPFEFLDKLKKNDWVVLELSSFQLEDLHKSPSIAVITNFYKEHLAAADPQNPNFHRTAKDYWNAKTNIFKHQKNGGNLIVNRGLFNKVAGKKIFFEGSRLFLFHSYDNSADSFFIDSDHLHLSGTSFKVQYGLPGEHNLENIAAAALAARLADAKIPDIQSALRSFKGLEHRLELVASIDKIDFYDDSFATTPESTITALRSFEGRIILLAGGAEKNSDFGKLAKEIKKRVGFLVLLDGKATPRIKRELCKIKYPPSRIIEVSSITSAVGHAYFNALPGDKILLSPACASFGMFKDYKERGYLFKQEVYSLAKRQPALP